MGALFILLGIVLLILAILIYFLPSIIAFWLDHKYAVSIFVINLFFGWTLIVWVICLAVAFFPTE
jgi:hypothetical protein